MADDELVEDREAAWELLTEWTKSEALRRHCLAVEASVRAYARLFGEDERAWGNVALLHDFDYERHPTLDQHPQDGAPVLREHGYPEWFVRAIQAHGNHTGVTRETRLEHTLYACDEVSGFVHACGLVRPDGLATLEVRSVRKKLKQPSFARGVNREEVVDGAQRARSRPGRAHHLRHRRPAPDRRRARASRLIPAGPAATLIVSQPGGRHGRAWQLQHERGSWSRS